MLQCRSADLEAATETIFMQKSGRLTLYILLAMILGITVGYACHILWPDPQTAATIAGYISLVTDLFLRLIKMIIAPLVFSTLVVGIAHMGDSKTVGRVGLKTMGWFITASLCSLTLGLIMVSIDLGRAIVDGISNELDGQTLKIRFVPVTPESRISAVVN